MFLINIRRTGKKGIKAIEVSLNDQLILFNGRAKVQLEKVIRDKSEEENNLFSCFNDYVDSVFTTEQKIKLFHLYDKAHSIVESGKFYDYNTEINQLRPIVDDILELVNVDKYCAFIQNSEYLKIPKNLSEAASKGDYPEQTTVTDNDYVNLVKLAFVVRTVYPIIFGLLNRFDQTMGSGYREVVCGELIKNNPYITRLYGWEKLNTYFRFSFDKRGIPTQIDGGGSSETFIEKVLFSAIFDRLCCAVIPETEHDKNIANSINGAVKQHETSTIFKPKEDRPGADEEDKRSNYDKYGITEEVKSSDQESEAEFFSFGLFDETDAPRFKDRFKYQCIALGIKNEKLVEKVYDNLPINWDFDMHNHIVRILELTYFEVVSAFIWEACNYTQFMAAIALAQVKLSEQGYKYLPSVLGAIHDPNGTRSLAEGLKLSDEDKNYLASICDVQSRNSENRGYNEALLAADSFLSQFGNGVWRSNLEYGVLDDPEIYDRVTAGDLFSIEVENEIKNEYMALIKQVNG
jgi:hypothetical protein